MLRIEEPQILLDDDGKEIKLNNVNTSELEIESLDIMFDDLNVLILHELKLEAEPLQIDNSPMIYQTL